MKKTVSLILIVVLLCGVLSFVACSDNNNPDVSPEEEIVIEKKSLIQQRNEAYEAEGKVKWYDYNDKEYSFGKLSFATILIDPCCISYSWKDMSKGYDMSFEKETKNSIIASIEEKLYARFNVSGEQNEEVYVIFTDASNGAVDEYCEEQRQLIFEIDPSYLEEEIEMLVYENDSVKIKSQACALGQFEEELYYYHYATSNSVLGMYATYPFTYGYIQYYSAERKLDTETNRASLVQYVYKNISFNGFYYTVIESKKTNQKYILACALKLSSEYKNAFYCSEEYVNDKEKAINEETERLLEIIKPYMDEIVNGYLLDEFGVVL